MYTFIRRITELKRANKTFSLGSKALNSLVIGILLVPNLGLASDFVLRQSQISKPKPASYTLNLVTRPRVSTSAIISEYKEFQQSKYNGVYGVNGGSEVIGAFQRQLVNYLIVRSSLRSCERIKALIPSLESGDYQFVLSTSTSSSLTKTFCLSDADAGVMHALL